jgi:two-component system invasion response regulator UvrY
MSTIRVLLVDDHGVVRMGFRLLLDTSGDIEVVGQADCAQVGMAALADAARPHLSQSRRSLQV